MNLDPASAVETIFEGHPTSPLADALQRHLVANLRDQMPIDAAFNRSLESTEKEWIDTKNALPEDTLRVHASQTGRQSGKGLRKR